MKRLFCALLALCLLTVSPPSCLASGQERFDNMQDLMQDLYENGTSMLADEVSYAYVSSMDETLNDAASVISMAYNLGIMTFGFEHDYEHRQAALTEIVYYPGFKIARAWAMNRTDLLNEQEISVLRQAENMVETARSGAQSPYELLIRLHDLLIERTTYTLGTKEWSDLDTAVGALLNGRADCDGYADAFYLLCTLADIPVRLQYGQATDQNGTLGPHKWNLVYWNDAWYHVDVTWDDVNWDGDPSATSYPYMLVGSSMLTEHTWLSEPSVCQAAEYTDWSAYYYTADSTGVSYGAYFHTIEDAAAYAAYMQREYGREQIHVMLDGTCQTGLETINNTLVENGLIGQWYLWGRAAGDYICLSITMVD